LTTQSDAIERRLRPAVWEVDLSPPIDPKRRRTAQIKKGKAMETSEVQTLEKANAILRTWTRQHNQSVGSSCRRIGTGEHDRLRGGVVQAVTDRVSLGLIPMLQLPSVQVIEIACLPFEPHHYQFDVALDDRDVGDQSAIGAIASAVNQPQVVGLVARDQAIPRIGVPVDVAENDRQPFRKPARQMLDELLQGVAAVLPIVPLLLPVRSQVVQRSEKAFLEIPAEAEASNPRIAPWRFVVRRGTTQLRPGQDFQQFSQARFHLPLAGRAIGLLQSIARMVFRRSRFVTDGEDARRCRRKGFALVRKTAAKIRHGMEPDGGVPKPFDGIIMLLPFVLVGLSFGKKLEEEGVMFSPNQQANQPCSRPTASDRFHPGNERVRKKLLDDQLKCLFAVVSERFDQVLDNESLFS
jgi:hypothetical protein